MIVTREVTYDVDGLRMIAHLAQPDGHGPWPGVLIGHDGVGLDEYQRQRAEDLAAHGYMALAMDYHGGEVFFDRPVAMLARVMPLLADVERMRAAWPALPAALADFGVAVPLGYRDPDNWSRNPRFLFTLSKALKFCPERPATRCS
jgi:dienelactone hydrolase